MKIKSKIIFYTTVMAIVLLRGWTTPETNINHTMIRKINLYGSIETHQGNRWNIVENIMIDGRYKQIQMFFKPELLPQKILNPQTNRDEITLQDDPNHYAQVKIDLEEIAELEAVPQLTYVYISPKGNKNYPTQYSEIIITLKDASLKAYHCLMPESTRLAWEEKSNSGPVHSTIQIGSLKKLIFEGSKTEEDGQKK